MEFPSFPDVSMPDRNSRVLKFRTAGEWGAMLQWNDLLPCIITDLKEGSLRAYRSLYHVVFECSAQQNRHFASVYIFPGIKSAEACLILDSKDHPEERMTHDSEAWERPHQRYVDCKKRRLVKQRVIRFNRPLGVSEQNLRMYPHRFSHIIAQGS